MISLIDVLISILLVSLASSAWLCIFRLTDFLSEYVTIINRILRRRRDFENREEFLEFLAEYAVEKDSLAVEFLYRLLMCPFCLAVWICFSFSFLLCFWIGWHYSIIIWFSSVPITVFIEAYLAEVV